MVRSAGPSESKPSQPTGTTQHQPAIPSLPLRDLEVDSTFSHRPSLSDRLDGQRRVDRRSPPLSLVCGW